MSCPPFAELPTEVNAETIRKAAAPLAFLLEEKSAGCLVGVSIRCTAKRSLTRYSLSKGKTCQGKCKRHETISIVFSI